MNLKTQVRGYRSQPNMWTFRSLRVVDINKKWECILSHIFMYRPKNLVGSNCYVWKCLNWSPVHGVHVKMPCVVPHPSDTADKDCCYYWGLVQPKPFVCLFTFIEFYYRTLMAVLFYFPGVCVSVTVSANKDDIVSRGRLGCLCGNTTCLQKKNIWPNEQLRMSTFILIPV